MVSKSRQKHLATGAGEQEGIRYEYDRYPPNRSPPGLTSNKVFEVNSGKTLSQIQDWESRVLEPPRISPSSSLTSTVSFLEDAAI